ncbi:CFEM domain-containing protein [Purpureocillium lavendulum]|uniref:CFEM domain-containing protein n=1 Tax=Purpureocillium lavendulum TaxID=1247861 RepID=A0AB34FII1_9HYPO|nr:CFEM domain-containing protein [Purpureocillium lavendulum]
MKFLLPVALATFAALTSATKEHDNKDKCDALEKKVPVCAQPCVNYEAKKYCTPGDLDCGCDPKTLEKIIADSATCVSNACKGEGAVFPPLRAWCKCIIGEKPTKTKTTTKPTATPTNTCAAEASKIPLCALDCTSEEAHKLCPTGDINKCGCRADNLDKIIDRSAACVAKACKGQGPVVPPLRNWCKCVNGGDDTTTTTTTSKHSSTKTTKSHTKTTHTSHSSHTKTHSHGSSTTPTKTGSASSSATETGSTSTGETSKPTTTSPPVTYTSTFTTTSIHTITSCAHNVTSCTAGHVTTETVITTTTWCPEETETAVPTGPPVETETDTVTTTECPETETETVVPTGPPAVTETAVPTGPPAETQPQPTPTEGAPGTTAAPNPSQPGGPGSSSVPSGGPITSQPPPITAGAAVMQRNAGFAAAAVAAFAGFAWL